MCRCAARKHHVIQREVQSALECQLASPGKALLVGVIDASQRAVLKKQHSRQGAGGRRRKIRRGGTANRNRPVVAAAGSGEKESDAGSRNIASATDVERLVASADALHDIGPGVEGGIRRTEFDAVAICARIENKRIAGRAIPGNGWSRRRRCAAAGQGPEARECAGPNGRLRDVPEWV